MIPANLTDAFIDAEHKLETLRTRQHEFPARRREVRATWADFVDAVRTGGDTAAAWRSYYATAQRVRLLADTIGADRFATWTGYTQAIGHIVNDINTRLTAATAYDNAGHSMVTPYTSPDERDAIIREALADAEELADRLGLDDYAAPTPTPEARRTPINISALTFIDALDQPPYVDRSLTVHDRYTAALDQAQTEILAAA